MSTLREIDGIICFSTDPWGEMKRPGQLMRCLSARVPVVYVDPSLSCTSIVKNWRNLAASPLRDRVRRAFARGARAVAPGIHVVTPLISTPPQRLSFALPEPALRAFSARQHARAARKAYRAAARLGMSSPVVWVSYPMGLTEIPGGRPSAVVYDCMDRWTDFPDSMADSALRSLVADLEGELLDRADVVLCSAAGLFEAKRAVAKGKTLLVRNAADVDHFAPTGRAMPDDIAALPRPILGYVGAVAEWVDFELLRDVAATRPDWSIVLVGPVFQGQSMGDAGRLQEIAGLANVHLLGPRPYADVPAYVEAFDVATIPFRCNGLTEDTNPIKVYEYLAAGVPVVSTPMPEVAVLEEVHLAADAPTFVEAVERARGERWDADMIEARIELARLNSWQSRADAAWGALLDWAAVAGER